MPVFQVDYLHRIYAALATRLGASADEAEIFAGSFSRADLRGKDTQGLSCIALVYPWIRSGGIRFGATLTTVREGPGYAVLDGGHGAGQVMAVHAMEVAIRKAREAGIGAAWLHNTNDFTMASNYSMQALEHDCIGIAMSNSVAYVAPWGGRDQIFGTNPHSIAIPAGDETPIVIDMSASPLSHGKVVMAARDLLNVPGPFLVDEQGRISDDPSGIIVDPLDRNSPQRGSIVPLGHRGFGWLILVDVLAGLLSGGTTSKYIPHDASADEHMTIGQFFLAIDVNAVIPIEEFKSKVDQFIRDVKSSRLAEGFDEIVLPGERAARTAERRAVEGIPVRDEEWAKIERIAAEVGLDLSTV